jgi:CRP-like cAMP-binding protein
MIWQTTTHTRRVRPEAKVESILSECVADAELADEIEKLSEPSAPTPSNLLFRQGDPPTKIYFVKKGEVELTMKASSITVMVVRAGPGSVLGLPAIVGDKPYTMSAKTCGESEICQVPVEQFRAMVRDNPKVSFNILRILAGEIRSARQALSALL